MGRLAPVSYAQSTADYLLQQKVSSCTEITQLCDTLFVIRAGIKENPGLQFVLNSLAGNLYSGHLRNLLSIHELVFCVQNLLPAT